MIFNVALASALCFSFAACEQKKPDSAEVAEDVNEDKKTGDAEDDAEHAVKAATGGMFEVEASRIAAEKGTSQSVKDFAKKMIEDHSKANDELKSLAAQKNITLPASLDNEHQEKVTKLSSLTGTEFDEEYMQAMEAAHKKDIDLFEDIAEDSDGDADLKAFAAKTLPIIKAHYEMADTKADAAEKHDKDGTNH